MRAFALSFFVFSALILSGCESGALPSGDTGVASDTGGDTARPDTGMVDTGLVDSRVPDTNTPDTGLRDAGNADTGATDTRTEDTSVVDTGAADTASGDASTGDTGSADVGSGDSGARVDASTPDGAASDGGVVLDTGVLDSGVADSAVPDSAVLDSGVILDAGLPNWVYAPLTAGRAVLRGVGRDIGGGVYIVGEFDDAITFGSTVLTPAGMRDIFLARIVGDTGELSWAVPIGGTGDDTVGGFDVDGTILAIAISGTGIVSYPTASSTLTTDLGSGMQAALFSMNAATHDVIGISAPTGLVTFADVDVAGPRVVACAGFNAPIVAGPATLTPVGSSDAVLFVYDSALSSLWVKQHGSSMFDSMSVCGADAAGNVFAGGNFGGAIDFGGGSRPPMGILSFFATGYTPTGAYSWDHVWRYTPSAGSYGLQDVVMTERGPAYIGLSQSMVALDPISTVAAGVWVVQVTTVGALSWNRSTGVSGAGVEPFGATNDLGTEVVVGTLLGASGSWGADSIGPGLTLGALAAESGAHRASMTVSTSAYAGGVATSPLGTFIGGTIFRGTSTTVLGQTVPVDGESNVFVALIRR